LASAHPNGICSTASSPNAIGCCTWTITRGGARQTLRSPVELEPECSTIARSPRLDFSLLTFKIKGVQVSETFEAKSFLGASNTFTAPDGTKYYSVELVGHLDGLHKKYHFVCFNSKRFLAIPDSAKGAQTKASYQGEAISTDFFGTVPDSYCGIPFGGGADEWHFTVVFVLPSGLKKFAIGVVDPKGQPVYTGAVVDLTPAPPAKARAPSH
jgi:hypothetical protein